LAPQALLLLLLLVTLLLLATLLTLCHWSGPTCAALQRAVDQQVPDQGRWRSGCLTLQHKESPCLPLLQPPLEWRLMPLYV
jgi:hypothetical protein